MKMPGINIIIPVFNEGDNISRALDLIFEKVTVPFHILIVYDFDEDTTVSVAKRYIEINNCKDRITLLKNSIGRGALNAIKAGLHHSTSEYVVVTMADLSDPPEVINTMLNKAVTSNAAIVCGSRYMPGGSQTGGPLIKRTLSRLAGLSLHYIAGIPTHDVTNSFKLYKKSFLQNNTIESTGGFELGLELVVKGWMQGENITEVPTSWQDRSNGKSNFKLFQWLPHYLFWYIKALRFHIKSIYFSKQKNPT